MWQLFKADLKLLYRNRQQLFWSIMFPLMFTVIFGFFFGGDQIKSGTLAVIKKSNTQLAETLNNSLKDSGLFSVKEETDENIARTELKNSKVNGILIIPENFGSADPHVPGSVKYISDPGNGQLNGAVQSFAGEFLTIASMKAQNAKPLFDLEIEKTNSRKLSYFDFVLIGLVGMALMNSSVQGIAISMSKYREDQILKRLTTTPLPAWKFITAEVLSRLILNAIQVSVILLIGVYAFHAHIYGNLLYIYAIALVGALLFQALGFTVASMSKTTQAAEGMATAVAIPMMFLAGVFFPIEQLPQWLIKIIQFVPLAPLLRSLRGMALESASPFSQPWNVVLVLAWIVILLAISTYRFKIVEE